MVSEAKIRAWVEPESKNALAAREKPVQVTPASAVDATRKRTAAAIANAVKRGQWDQVASLTAQQQAAERATVSRAERGVILGAAIDWTKSPAEINADLRTLFVEIRAATCSRSRPSHGPTWPRESVAVADPSRSRTQKSPAGVPGSLLIDSTALPGSDPVGPFTR